MVAGAVLVVATWGLAAETDLTGLVEPYLHARTEQALGVAAARAYAEPARPGAAPLPQADVSVVLLPYSAVFEAELDAVKAGLRDSVDSYTQAVARIEAARVDYERALVAVGAGELVRSEVTDGQGTARLTGLPAGDWLLLAWHEGGHMSRRYRIRDQDAQRFPNVPTNVTYSVVTYWRSRVTIRKGETAEIAVNDRNAWMTAGRQESGTPRTPRSPSSGAPKRR